MTTLLTLTPPYAATLYTCAALIALTPIALLGLCGLIAADMGKWADLVGDDAS